MRRRLNTGRNVVAELIETQLCQLLREPAAFVRTAQPSTSHRHASTLLQPPILLDTEGGTKRTDPLPNISQGSVATGESVV